MVGRQLEGSGEGGEDGRAKARRDGEGVLGHVAAQVMVEIRGWREAVEEDDEECMVVDPVDGEQALDLGFILEGQRWEELVD